MTLLDDRIHAALLPDIRRVAAQLQNSGNLRATQRGQDVRVDTAKAPIRLSLPTGQGQGAF